MASGPMELTGESRNIRTGWNFKDNLFNPLFYSHKTEAQRELDKTTWHELDSCHSAI